MRLEVGSIVEAKVTGITNFGAFVELPDGKKGMVHISEVAPKYVEKISDHLSIGQQVKVKVLSVSDDGKISLSIKNAMETPKPHGKPKKQRTSAPSSNTSGSKGPGNFEWQPKRSDMSFEDMLSRFKQTSDEKISALKRGEPTPRRRKPQK